MRSLIVLFCLAFLSLSACDPFFIDGEPGPFVHDDSKDGSDY